MLLKYFAAHSRSMFLIDGLGALLSTLLLFVLVYYNDLSGMPKQVLYQLLPVTAIFAIYSLGTYVRNPKNWKRYLAAIAVANMLYCCLTVVLLLSYFNRLTLLGRAYFSVEIFIILLLSGFELALIFNKPPL